MPRFEVTVDCKMSRRVEVEADTREGAMAAVDQMVREGGIDPYTKFYPLDPPEAIDTEEIEEQEFQVDVSCKTKMTVHIEATDEDDAARQVQAMIDNDDFKSMPQCEAPWIDEVRQDD